MIDLLSLLPKPFVPFSVRRVQSHQQLQFVSTTRIVYFSVNETVPDNVKHKS